jgi:TonB family protein
VRAAVQAAFVYPPAAKAAEFVGRTRVAFNLMDAKVSGARVLIGSGMGLVDKAALQAVQKANYPTPPGEQKSTELSFEIWVEFRP